MNRLETGNALIKDSFLRLKFSLVQDLLVPLEVEDFATTLIALHNSGLVDLSHVQVQGTTVAECHRITSGAFERPCRENNLKLKSQSYPMPNADLYCCPHKCVS